MLNFYNTINLCPYSNFFFNNTLNSSCEFYKDKKIKVHTNTGAGAL